MSTIIQLSHGYTSLIDVDDFERVSRLKWFLRGGRQLVAAANVGKLGIRKQILLHRFIMNAEDGQFIDHIDRDTLNNQKSNLRFCTHWQNAANRKSDRITISGLRGVRVQKRDSGPRYFAEVKREYKTFRGPRRPCAEEAAADYDALAMRLFGEFAILNFPIREDGINA